jgi:glycosyltransferase involved in cell wall biosynthesis
MEALAETLDLTSPHLTFAGSQTDVSQILTSSGMLVQTSESEGCPNVVLEAMAARTPVIATPAGDTPELIRDGETGWLVPFNDPQAIADKMLQIAHSPQSAASMTSAAYDLVKRLHSVDGLSKRLFEIYSAVVWAGSNTTREEVDMPLPRPTEPLSTSNS